MSNWKNPQRPQLRAPMMIRRNARTFRHFIQSSKKCKNCILISYPKRKKWVCHYFFAEELESEDRLLFSEMPKVAIMYAIDFFGDKSWQFKSILPM